MSTLYGKIAKYPLFFIVALTNDGACFIFHGDMVDSNYNENSIIRLVRMKELYVDNQGRIWRRFKNYYKLISTRNSAGYIIVFVERHGVRLSCYAHRLVWRNFVGRVPPGFLVHHRNGIKHDNRLDNLELVTPKQNFSIAVAVGAIKIMGQDNPNATLTDEEIDEIKYLGESDIYNHSDIAAAYGVSRSHISMILSGKRRSQSA